MNAAVGGRPVRTQVSRTRATALVLGTVLMAAACGSAPQTPGAGPDAPATVANAATSSSVGRTSTAAPTTGTITADPTTQQPSPAVALAPAAFSGCPKPAASIIRLAPGTGQTVALTFDDGADPAMITIANILRSKGVNATFFDTGAHDSTYPVVVRQVSAMGFLIENHSWDHDYPSQTPTGWSGPYLRDQIARTSATQEHLTGRPSCFFRPPGGYLTNVVAAASAQGLSPVLWSVDTRDWAQPGGDDPAYVATIVANATTLTAADREHPIVLMHAAKASHEPESQVSSYRGNTIAALPQIIDWYAAHGYRFVNLLGEA